MGDLSIPINDLEMLFADEEQRLKTFQRSTWPDTAPVQSKDLARAGFIYTGNGQEVECFTCHVKYSNWKYGEIAIKKHRELNPECPFVKKLSSILADHNKVVRGIYYVPNNGSPVINGNMHMISEYETIWKDRCVSLVKESERLKTYAGWPLDFIRPEDLARAGFVYLKVEDRVQCVFCKGIVSQWEREDVPLQEHSRHFPRCPFIKGVDRRNVSIEDEIRSHILLNVGSGGEDVCGSRPMDMRTFKPERPVPISSSYEDLNIIQHKPPKYPAFATKEGRLKSFNECWPTTIPQDVMALVDAGFFYTGTGDSVTCFHCGGGLKNWEENDIPFEEHARWFPRCSFVVLNKGKDYIQKAKLNKPPVLKVQVPKQSSSDINESELDVLLQSEVAEEVLKMGFNRYKVREALRQRWNKVNYNFTTADDLASAVLELKDVQIPTPTPQPIQALNSVVGNGGTQIGLTSPTTSQEDTEKILPSPSGSCLPQRKSGDLNAEQEFRLCKLCMDKEMSVVFLPCGHFVACTSCASSLTSCPVCRADIKCTVRTFLP